MSNKQKEKGKKTKGNKKIKKKMKLWKKVVIFLLIIILTCIGILSYKTYKNGGGLAGFLATAVGHNEFTKKNLGELKVLLLGVSTDQEGVFLTDTIIVATYNPNTQKAKLLSIPRDTYVGRNAKSATAGQKLNALYGSDEKPERTLKSINEITGLDIKYYAVIKTEALINLVNAIGDVEFDVPIDMDYDDTSQDLHIHLKKGVQKLNGQKAEELVRFRHNNNGTSYPEEYGDNDYGRMRTQRDFITAVLKQTLKPSNIFKLGQILEIAKKDIITNIEFSYIKDYLPYAVEFNTEDLETETLPGTSQMYNGIWFFIYNRTETKALIQNMFYSPEYIGNSPETINNEDYLLSSSSSATNNKTTNNKTTNNKTTNNNKNIKIELLNGCGDNSIFQKAYEMIENAGYNITKTGATTIIPRTVIANKKEIDETDLKNIKELLRAGNISNSKSSTSLVDITIIIGSDFQ